MSISPKPSDHLPEVRQSDQYTEGSAVHKLTFNDDGFTIEGKICEIGHRLSEEEKEKYLPLKARVTLIDNSKTEKLLLISKSALKKCSGEGRARSMGASYLRVISFEQQQEDRKKGVQPPSAPSQHSRPASSAKVQLPPISKAQKAAYAANAALVKALAGFVEAENVHVAGQLHYLTDITSSNKPEEIIVKGLHGLVTLMNSIKKESMNLPSEIIKKIEKFDKNVQKCFAAYNKDKNRATLQSGIRDLMNSWREMSAQAEEAYREQYIPQLYRPIHETKEIFVYQPRTSEEVAISPSAAHVSTAFREAAIKKVGKGAVLVFSAGHLAMVVWNPAWDECQLVRDGQPCPTGELKGFAWDSNNAFGAIEKQLRDRGYLLIRGIDLQKRH